MTAWVNLPSLGIGEGALLTIATLLGLVLFLSLMRRERPRKTPPPPEAGSPHQSERRR